MMMVKANNNKVSVAESRLRLFTILIITVSIIIPLTVFLLLFTSKPTIEHNINLKILPAFHAILNGITAILLIIGYFLIRNGKVLAHKSFMLTAVLCSVLFLVSYVTYHSLSGSTEYGGEGFLKSIYYFVLISHIILAVVIVPLVLFTLFRALTHDFPRHKKIARWTLPIWLYVAITGVLVYLMISPYYA